MGGSTEKPDAPELGEEPSTRPASPAPFEKGRKPCLTVLHGATVGQCYWFGADGVLIGRSRSAALAFQDDTISRKHAQIVFDGHDFVLRDLVSKNGTWLNGERVVKDNRLADGDKVLLGANVLLRFDLTDPADERFQEQLRAGVTRDLLTGAFNEHHLVGLLNSERAYAHRHGEPLSVLLVRLDALETIAAELGAGPSAQVLVQMARMLGQQIRTEDMLGRMSDDVFCVVLRGVPPMGAAALGQRIRKQVAQFSVPGLAARATATTSAVDASPAHAETIETVWEEARALLAEGKSRGGDCVLTAADLRAA